MAVYISSLLIEASYLADAFKYTLRKPARTNIVHVVQESPFSVYEKVCCELSFTLYEVVDLFKANETLEWLNNSFNVDEDKSISQGFLRPDFRYGEDSRNRIV
ncbi:hypothetical protein ABMA77_08755 [Halobacteriovorax sp. RZ-1]|uniref:hypothetical protein n=1 Tax=unclassified Halobacteriovorax TaxID=2639665 RepID=UPI0037219C61